MVAAHLDANYIFAEPMRNKTDGKQLHVYQKIIDRMRRAKLGLKKHVLDNKISKEYRERIVKNNMTHKLAAPGNHRTLMAERAIQTWKAHMVSNLNGVDKKIPISCWCKIVSQTELTLNLLRQSNISPNISAYAHVHGQHDYMRNLFAPIGCRVEVHIKPDNQATWEMHCKLGFSVGTLMEHYRCYKVIKSSIQHTVVCDTAVSHHPTLACPELSPKDRIIHCL
jgi:hypothetical protein